MPIPRRLRPNRSRDGFDALSLRLDELAAQLRDEIRSGELATREAVDAVLRDHQQLAWATGERVGELERRVDRLVAAQGAIERELELRIDEHVTWAKAPIEQELARRRVELDRGAAWAALVLRALLSGVLPGDVPSPETRGTLVSGGHSRVICTRATGPHRGLLALGVPVLEAYARRWGWDLVVSTEERIAAGRPASWGKLPLVRDLAGDYSLVWWVDSDAILVALDQDIAEHLVPGRDLFLVEHTFTWDYGDGPQTHRFPNAGVFLVRGGETGRQLVDELWAREDLIDSHWWENTALLDLLGYDLYPMRPARETPWTPRVAFLPKAWNSLDDLDEAPEPILKHHAGNAPFDERMRRMLGDRLDVQPAVDAAAALAG